MVSGSPQVDLHLGCHAPLDSGRDRTIAHTPRLAKFEIHDEPLLVARLLLSSLQPASSLPAQTASEKHKSQPDRSRARLSFAVARITAGDDTVAVHHHCFLTNRYFCLFSLL
jgi:hypothetical protein